MFGINLKNVSEIVTFDPELASQPVDQYLLLPADNGLLSKYVLLISSIQVIMTRYFHTKLYI